ncbi:MAG: carboxypeptidase regulatory-like domain-containing protein [Pyrinomonadaceae bacterium]|nr:carboxypeptidase regulatory-like domain-containing protein [Pyrinomonadaceae bacterium]
MKSRNRTNGPGSSIRRARNQAKALRLSIVLMCLLALAAGIIMMPKRMAEASSLPQNPQQAIDNSLTEPQQLAAQNGDRSSDGIWRKIEEAVIERKGERQIVPASYLTLRLNREALLRVLNQAPKEFSAAAKEVEVIMTLPMPDGTFQRFRIEESPIMEPELAAKFPEIKTYKGQGLDDPTATTRFDLTPQGFHAIVLSAKTTVYVDPYAKGDTENYITYDKQAARRNGESFECLVNENNYFPSFMPSQPEPEVTNGATLKTYRLALAATGEYTTFHGGTVALGQAAIVTAMNRVNGIYEREVSIRMALVSNNNLIVYTNPSTDPYSNTNPTLLLTQNQANLDAVIGTANYDIGHVFSTGGGGVATLNSPCNAATKARGETGLPSPTGDVFWVDFVAHEMGHQWGGNHTFNGTTDNCVGGNRNASTAYEPGSGSTIQGYAGICGAEDLQPNSNDYFHVVSLEEIVAYITTGAGNNCDAPTATGNSIPTVNGGADFNIPANTPFTLTATASDANGDALTYDWEQYDLGAAGPPNTDNGARPIFRSYSPTTSPSRTFPSLQYILNNANVPPTTSGSCPSGPCLTGESLASFSPGRNLTFQVTVRDNRAGGGGINTDTVEVNTTNTGAAFAVTAPNTVTTWNGGLAQTVTWNVAGTTAAPISAANVRITLSTDGGNTFPTVLSASTPNDGSQSVLVPATSTATARVKVEAVGNIFFDISNVNFAIDSVTSAPANLGGRVTNASGQPVGGVSISLLNTNSSATLVTTTNANGNYQFNAMETGVDYLVTPALGGYSFNPSNRLLSHTLEILDVNFVATQGGAQLPSRISDFDGDGVTDISVFRPDNGGWYILRSSDQVMSAQQFGMGTDRPVPGDYDADGKTDIAVFRQGIWYMLLSSNGAFRSVQFGQSGDIPVAADYDRDGRTDPAVFRQGVWYILRSSDNGFRAVQFGLGSDIPVTGDFNGDRMADHTVFRNGTWYILQSFDVLRVEQFGLSSDTLVPGDYDGDTRVDPAVFRNGVWTVLRSSDGISQSIPFGFATDRPAPGDYDGDGKTDVGVFRPSDGTWYLLPSLNNNLRTHRWGGSGDMPVPSAYLP